MRHLSRQQKRLLNDWFRENKSKITFSFTVQDLPNDLYDQLEQLNDFETLIQAIESYVRDLVSEDVDRQEEGLTKRREE